MSQSPFKFLDSYTKEDKDIFFGRETEVEDVYTKIFQSKMLLVYGASGTGKSSLISCGLANKFQDTDWLPVNVRRGVNINASMRQQLEKCMLTPLNSKGVVSLARMLKSVYLDHFKPIYLVFDQFEELFIFGERDEWSDFIASVRQVLDSDIQVRFVFCIRGEYLEYLTEFENVLPEIFSNRIRIEKMTRTSAVNCITGPCHAAGIELEHGFPENLLTKLSPNKTEIELTYLQVFLDRIFKKASEKTKDDKIVFSNALLEELGNVGDVLSQFLDEQIELIPDSENALTLLKAFVSTDATKKQITSEQAEEFAKTIGKDLGQKQVDLLIQELVNRRILKDKDEAGRYELRHDSIAAKIFDKITSYERDLIEVNQFITYALGEHEKRNFLLNESDLAYIAPYETKLNLSAKVQGFIEKSKAAVRKKNRSRKTFYAVMGVISILLITSILGLVYSQRQKAEADKNATLAKEQSGEAIKQKELAEQQKVIAEQKQLEADKQAMIAREQSILAENEKQRANQARQMSEQQRALALEEKSKAETAQREATINAELANQQRALANVEKKKADELRMIALARSIAAKSTQVEDKEVKALLALQAWKFNQEFGGYAFQGDIYTGLYQANEGFLGEDFNTSSLHASSLKSMVYSDPFLYTGGSDGVITKTKVDSYKISKNIFSNTKRVINVLAISKDGTRLAAGTDEGPILVLDSNTGATVKELAGHTDGVWTIQFVGQKLLSAGKDNKVFLWDIEKNSKLVVASFNSVINKIDINKNENTAIAGLANGKVVLLPLVENSKAEVIYEKTGNPVTSFVVGPSQMIMAVGYGNGLCEVKLIKPNTTAFVSTTTYQKNAISNLMFSENGTLSINLQKAAITSLLFSPDGRFLFSSSMDGKVLIWDVEARNEQPIVLENHEGWVNTSCLANKGTWLVTGDGNGKMRVFPTDPGELAKEFCTRLSKNLTEDQWSLYIGEDIAYRKTCENK